SLDEGFHLRIVHGPPKIARGNDYEEVAREKYGDRGHEASQGTGNEVSDEGEGDHDRAWRDHRDCDGVEELPLGQPAEIVHHHSVEEGHDREAAAEDKGARFRETIGNPAR